MIKSNPQLNLINPISFEELKQKINFLTHKTVKKILNVTENKEINIKNKGFIGQLVERYLGLKNNSFSEPDLGNVEIKTIPIKFDNKNNLKAKERMVISKVDFNELKNKTFDENHNIQKIKNVLFVCYKFEESKEPFDYEFLGSFLFKLDELDDNEKTTINNDYKKLKGCCENKELNQISSSLTSYLEMCTKGRNNNDFVIFENQKIMQRAFAFKNNLMTKILNKYYDFDKNEFILESTNQDLFNNLDNIINQLNDKDLNEDFIQKTDNKKSTVANNQIEWLKSIFAKYNTDFDLNLATNNQFKKWLISRKYIVKNISIDESLNVKESMSFSNFKFFDIATNEPTEDETFYSKLAKNKFIFLVTLNLKEKYKLLKIIVHKFDEKDIDNFVIPMIQNTKNILCNNLILTFNKKTKNFSNNFIGSKQNPMCHIRPHANNRNNMYKLPYCTNIVIENFDENDLSNSLKDIEYVKKIKKEHSYTKQCFWINNTYLHKIIFKK